MKGYVDKDTCIGCGLCTSICEEIFFMNDNGKAEAKDIVISQDIKDAAEDARVQCPVEAIDIK
ncbi:MAG: ferredoxin [Clostridiaceae bacterium]